MEGTAGVGAELAERVAATPRGRRTAARIVEATIGLLEEAGPGSASMRAIAERADVSLGSAYHYFPSKAHLVAAIYERALREVAADAADLLRRRRTLDDRLRAVWGLWLQRIEPYRGALDSLASGPGSAASADPFAGATEELREAGIELYRRVVEGSSSRVPPELRQELPGLLWMAHAAFTRFWARDSSPGRRRTARLLESAPDLIARLLALSALPGFADLRRRVASLLRALSKPAAT